MRGCCFLPRQLDGTDRYFGVEYEKFGGTSRVFNMEMWFNPTIPFAGAEDDVRREAPPGSTLVSSKKRSDCVVMTFKSSALSRAFRSKSAVMQAGLYSSANGGPFTGQVMDIVFLPTRATGC